MKRLKAAFVAATSMVMLAGCGEDFDGELLKSKTAAIESTALSMMARDKKTCTMPDELATVKGVKAVFNNPNDQLNRLIRLAHPAEDLEFLNAVYRYERFVTISAEYVYGSPRQLNKAADLLATLDRKDIALRAFTIKVDHNGNLPAYVAGIYQVGPQGGKALNLQVAEDSISSTAMIKEAGLDVFMAQLNKGALNEPGLYAIYRDPLAVDGQDTEWRVQPVMQGASVQANPGIKMSTQKIPQDLCLR